LEIVDVKATPVAVPVTQPEVELEAPLTRNLFTAVIVELVTEEGLIGVGESHAPISAEVTKLIVDSLRPILVGEDPMNVEPLRRKLYAACNLTHLHVHAANWAISGVDMALWDLVGKSAGKPLHRLWGGAFRERIPFYGSIARTKPEGVASQAARLVAEGFKTLYLKVGFDPDEDLECVRLMREAAESATGRVEVRVDANQAWSAGEAVRVINKMARYDPEFVDQPVLMYNLDAMKRVRKAVGVPIASHESSWSFYDALNVVKHEAADIIHIDPRFDAGFTGARVAAGIAEAAGMPVVSHHWAMLGVSTAAYMQLIASAPNFTLANQTGYNYLVDDVIEGGPMKMRDGCMELPEKPGIGVELDQTRLVRYATRYEETVKGSELEARLTPYQLMGYRRFFGH